MIRITRAAQRQIDDLIWFYLEEKQRPEAARRLRNDLRTARHLIIAEPNKGLPYPRPYPALQWLEFRWLLVRAYWISWGMRDGGPVVTNVFHASADIKGRASPSIEDAADW